MDQYKDVEELFLKLYEEYVGSIFRHCYFRVSSRDTAEDLTQEAFMRVWDYLAEGKTIDNPKAFLYRVAENLIVDYYRKKKELSLDALAESGFDPVGDNEDPILDYAAGRQAREAIKKLAPTHREILVLRYVDDLSIRDIALVIGQSENVVSVRIHRGVQKLKEILTYGKSH